MSHGLPELYNDKIGLQYSFISEHMILGKYFFYNLKLPKG